MSSVLLRSMRLFLVYLIFCTLNPVHSQELTDIHGNEIDSEQQNEDDPIHSDELPEIRANVIDSEQQNEDDSIDLSMYGERIFGSPITRSTVSSDNGNQNPEELGPYLEGDILIPIRNGIVGKSYRWPNGVVPYEIAGQFTSSELAIIRYAINEFHKRTCIRFRPRTTADADYISIVNGNTGCWSSIGRLGGRQEVNLQSRLCMRTYGTPIHELMHAIGFFHEQNRHERDSYVRVLNENIKPGMSQNFAKYSSRTSYGYGVPYDYASVLHYSSRSFSVNGKPTLLALLNTTAARSMGQRSGFSSGDIAKINAMYRCSKA